MTIKTNNNKVHSTVAEPLKSIDPATIFQALDTAYLVLSTDDPDFTILEENEAHARIDNAKRSAAIGKPLRDALPETTEVLRVEALERLTGSIRTAIREKKPHSLRHFQYDLKGEDGSFTPHYWSLAHHPIFGKDKEVVAVYQEARDITEQTRMSERLYHAEQQLDQVFASSMLGTWSWDLEQGLVFTDTNLAKLFGMTEREIRLGLPLDKFIALIHLDDQRKVQVAIDKTLKTGHSYEAEHRITSPDGAERWVIARGHLEYNKNGKSSLFSGVMLDITDRKRAERAVSENERRMRFMADSIPQLSWIARPDGYREYFNKQWYEFTGSDLEGSQGDGWHELVHPSDKTRVIDAWKRSYTEGVEYEIEYRLYHAPSKSYRWLIGRALPYRNDAGKILNWYGTSTDIHEQKRTAQRQTFLADISKELASTLNYTKMLRKVTKLCVPAIADWCSIDIFEEEKGFTQVSLAHANPEKVSLAREYRRFNPIDVDQPVGVANVIRTGNTEFYPNISDELLEQYIEDKKRLRFMKSLNLHSIIIAPLRVGGELVGGISFVTSDSGRYYDSSDLQMIEELAGRISLAITNSKLYDDSVRELERRQQVERELLREKETLEARVQIRTEQRVQHLVELNRSKDEFISIASHQLRTPATGVKQYVGMLLEGFVGDLEPKQRRLLEKAYENNERQLKIVTDLLRVAQVDAGKVVLRKSKVHLNAFIDDILRDHHGVYSSRHQTIRYKPLHPDITLQIDEASIRMVLENLIDNASKYSEEHKHVEVLARDNADGTVTIQVRDEGVGIDPEGHARLFEKFSRINNVLSTKVGGTGLGLYWAKKIVDLHGGKISHRSHGTGGTTFSIKLPKK